MKCKHYAIASMMLVTCFTAIGETVRNMEVFYFPFKIEPQGSISAKSITSDDILYALTKEDEALLRNEFLNAIRIGNNKFTFEEGRARLSVMIDDTTYVCDAKGNCMSNKFDLIVVKVERLEKILYKYFEARLQKHLG